MQRVGVFARGIVGVIRTYQVLGSPLVGNSCRFFPSCSNYAREAIGTHGLMRGSWLAITRVSRCHRWHPGGFDPVPGRRV